MQQAVSRVPLLNLHEWASRIPGTDNEMVEVRRMFELTDFPADVREKFEKPEQEIAEGGNQLSEQ